MELSMKAKGLVSSQLNSFFEKAETTPGVIRLDVGQFNEPTPEHICAEAEKALRGGMVKYTNILGYPKLRELIAQKHNCQVRNIAVGPGSKILLREVLSLICDPRDLVVMLAPSYPPYARMCKSSNAQTLCIGPSDDFNLNAERIREYLNYQAKYLNGSRLLIINSPNNPTGVVYSKEQLESLAKVVREYDLLVLTDDAYVPIVYKGKSTSFAELPGMAEHTITIRSFSKQYNMTGWRVGYVIAPEQFIEKLKIALGDYVGCASYISQQAAIAALEGPQQCVEQMIEELNRRRQYIMHWLDKRGIFYPSPQGAFYVFAALPQHKGMDDIAFANFLLEKAGVAVTPGSGFYPFAKENGYVRISYASSSQEQLEESFAKIDKII